MVWYCVLTDAGRLLIGLFSPPHANADSLIGLTYVVTSKARARLVIATWVGRGRACCIVGIAGAATLRNLRLSPAGIYSQNPWLD
jgi:hypothetical protein